MYQRITHEEAEQLLRNKKKEIGQTLDEQKSAHARMTIEERWKLLVAQDQDAFEDFVDWVTEGVNALLDFLEKKYGVRDNDLQRLAELASGFYEGLNHESHFDGLKVSADEFADAIRVDSDSAW